MSKAILELVVADAVVPRPMVPSYVVWLEPTVSEVLMLLPELVGRGRVIGVISGVGVVWSSTTT